LHDTVVTVAFGLCSALLPTAQSTWLQAMRTEVKFIRDRPEARAFAIGCIWVCLKRRVSTMEFAVKATRSAITFGMLALGILAAFSAWRAAGAHGPTGLVFAALAVAFVASCAWSHIRGPEALVQAASTMLLINIVAFIGLRTRPGEGWNNLDMYRALALEGVLIWGALLGGALFLMKSNPARA
jgi:hypothetical protein